MNKIITGFVTATLLTNVTLNAQESKPGTKQQEKDATPIEKKEIIIEEKAKGKTEKMVIKIDGNKVTINGVPAEDYKGKKHIVIDNEIVINGDEVHIPRKGSVFFHGFENSNRAMLGVLTEKDEKGARIKEVLKESAAEKAGLKEGDVITKLNGTTINDNKDLVATIEKLKPNDEAAITYLRNGKQKKATTRLGKADSPMAMAWNMDPANKRYPFKIDPPLAITGPRGNHPFFNDEDRWMFREDKPKYGMSIEDHASGDGVKITSIEAESNAEKAGLRADDIITEVDGKPVKGVEEIKEALRDSDHQTTVTLKVLRSGKIENIAVKVPKLTRKADL